jgi:hypothetical protein
MIIPSNQASKEGKAGIKNASSPTVLAGRRIPFGHPASRAPFQEACRQSSIYNPSGAVNAANGKLPNVLLLYPHLGVVSLKMWLPASWPRYVFVREDVAQGSVGCRHDEHVRRGLQLVGLQLAPETLVVVAAALCTKRQRAFIRVQILHVFDILSHIGHYASCTSGLLGGPGLSVSNTAGVITAVTTAAASSTTVAKCATKVADLCSGMLHST